jgi:hypothetical protein
LIEPSLLDARISRMNIVLSGHRPVFMNARYDGGFTYTLVKLRRRAGFDGSLYVMPRPDVTNIHSRKSDGRMSCPVAVYRGPEG